jgi:predicted ArsR family transcriptional regulator
MSRDAIVNEVRAHRKAIAREHGDDLKAVIDALRRKQGADGRPVVSFVAKENGSTQARRKAG